MLDYENITDAYLSAVKRYLKITWSDTETDNEIWMKMCRAEYVLNDKLGAEFDYFSAPCLEQSLYLSYMLYAWNNCESDFDEAYKNDILQIRAANLVNSITASSSSDDDDEDENEA